jgi:uncharacterized protein (TIGR03083 family)
MPSAPDREALRAELEATRAAYHELLASLSEDDWNRKSGNPDLTVKELLWHLAWAMGWMARSAEAVRRGRSLRLPASLIEPGRKFAMRWLARGATREAAARAYDEGHAALLARFDATRDDEWSRSANRLGEVRTVGWYFRQPAEHFAEHAADVRRGLGPGTSAEPPV